MKRDVPSTANDQMISMSSAIVRNCIANSTINEIIRNRKMITDSIKKEMLEVVKGWGVWIEAIEITDVKIMSASLFKDLQSNFRETKKQEAEMNALEIANKLETEKLQATIVMNEKRNDTNSTINNYASNINLKISQNNNKV